MKVIYISGCYRSKWGLIGRIINIWKARRAAIRLWKEGFTVICPHMNTALFPEDGIDYIGGDCEIIRRCADAIYLLEGWRNSEGARKEFAVAMDKRIRVYCE